MEQLKINEIFYSIQGESTWAGIPTVFVRTSGCHLRCTYCDTQLAYSEGSMVGVNEVLAEIDKFQSQYVCITGGEPLLQKSVYPLMHTLCNKDYKVSLETSGSISCADVDPRVKKVIDVKTPDSGEGNSFDHNNLTFTSDFNTDFKFVICSEKDFTWAETFVRENQLNKVSTVLYSPSFGKISEKWLAKKILFEKSSARLQLQLHKYIWDPEKRGV